MSVLRSITRKYLFSPGDSIGDFTVISAIGHGSYGEVYYVSDPLGMRFALKIILEPVSDESAQEVKGISLLREQVRTGESLPRIYHVGKKDDLLYYTMDAADNCSNDPDLYIPDTLQQRIENRQIFSAEEILDIAVSLLKSIQTLHQRDIVHRDIKPSNIIFMQGKCVLTDFGLVSADPKTFIGSPGFLAPCPSGGVTLKSQKSADLYSLGKIIYCLFSGKPAEHFPLLPQKFSLQDFAVIRPLYQKACAADPEKRFQSCEEFYGAVMKIKFPEKNNKVKNILKAVVILLCISVAAALIFALFHFSDKTKGKEHSPAVQGANAVPGQEVYTKIFDTKDGYRILVCFTNTSDIDADPHFRPNQFKAMKFVKEGIKNHLQLDDSQKAEIKFIRYLKQPFIEGNLLVYIYFIDRKDLKITGIR